MIFQYVPAAAIPLFLGAMLIGSHIWNAAVILLTRRSDAEQPRT